MLARFLAVLFIVAGFVVLFWGNNNAYSLACFAFGGVCLAHARLDAHIHKRG